MKKIFKNNYKNGAGFTILEVIIAIFLITVGLISVYSAATYLTSSSRISKGKLIASQFAQEGIEAVRNIRDRNWMEERDWRNGLGDNVYIPVFYNAEGDNPSGGWSLAVDNNPSAPENDDRTRIYAAYDSDELLFYFQVSDLSNLPTDPADYRTTSFRRWIILEYDSSDGKLKITSRIQWRENGIPQKFEIVDYLYDWQVPLNECPSDFSPGRGSLTGVSYYSGGGIDACTGQEAAQSSSPYRADDSQVCISDIAVDFNYNSIRTGQSVCESISGTGINFHVVVNPQ